jgi:hypothetical protein
VGCSLAELSFCRVTHVDEDGVRWEGRMKVGDLTCEFSCYTVISLFSGGILPSLRVVRLQDGERHGRGTLYFPDGACQAGRWINGVMSGPGEYIDDDGSRLQGMVP